MLYISLTLIAIGLYIILYSLLYKSEERSDIKILDHPLSPYEKGGNDILDDVKQENNNETLKVETKDEKTDNERSALDENDLYDEELDVSEDHVLSDPIILDEEIEDDESLKSQELFEDLDERCDDNSIDSRYKEEISSDVEAEDEYYAVLYEDSSSIFDYDNNTSIIDSTLNEYKKINRVGRGKIELMKDGLNFNIERKFFRFDFHRIEDIKYGDNFFSLFLKGSDVVRLFLFENNNLIGNDLRQIYKNFLMGF